MSKIEHTPTPWAVDGVYVMGVIDASPYTLADLTFSRHSSIPLAKVNAAFIVEAVNNYAVLAQKLQNCVHALTFCIDGWDEADPYIQKLRVTRDGAQTALDALAKDEPAA